MNRHPFLRSASVALLLMVCTSAASAQQRMTLESLVKTSEAVIVARTVQTESFWNDDRTAILTRVVLDVEDQLSGQATSRTEVIVPGGRIGNIIHEVSDMPTFEAEEESVVFLERHRSGILIVSGGLHGKLPVTRDNNSGIKVVGGASDFFREAPEDADAPVEVDDQPIPLDDFKIRFQRRIR